MNNNRLWILVVSILSIAIIALGYFIGVSPKLAEKSAADDQLTSVEAQNVQYAADLAALQKQYEGIDDIRAELEGLRGTLPADGGADDFLLEINALAAAAGVTIDGYSQETPIVYGAAAAADSTAGTEPVSGGSLLAIPVSITVSAVGDGNPPFTFLHQTQLGTRLFLAGGYTLTREVDDKGKAKFILVITGYIWTLVEDTVTAAPTTDAPAAETPAPTDTSTETPAPTETPVVTP